MKNKFIITWNDKTEKTFLCSFNEKDFSVIQTAKSYCTGVKEFDSYNEAQIVSSKLWTKSTKSGKLWDIDIIGV